MSAVRKNNPLVKVLLISIIVAVLGYIGLDVPRDSVEKAVEEQFSDTSADTATEQPVSQLYDVVSVIDGDTFKVLQNGEVSTVRLIGIDTPETRYSERGEECYGEEATREAVRLLEDTRVILQTDSTQASQDTYGRLLAYAIMEDGRDFGEVMVGSGFAKEYTYANAYRNQQKYKEAETSAMNERLGLWGCE